LMWLLLIRGNKYHFTVCNGTGKAPMARYCDPVGWLARGQKFGNIGVCDWLPLYTWERKLRTCGHCPSIFFPDGKWSLFSKVPSRFDMSPDSKKPWIISWRMTQDGEVNTLLLSSNAIMWPFLSCYVRCDEISSSMRYFKFVKE
jgi:hypothetical protein